MSSILSFLDLPMVSLQSRIMDFLLILRNRKLHVWVATLSAPSNSEHQAVALSGPCRREGEREQYIPCRGQEGGTWTRLMQISILILKTDQEEGTYRHSQVCRRQSKQCKVGWEQATGSSAEVLRKSSKRLPLPPKTIAEQCSGEGGEVGGCRERMLHLLRAAEKQGGSNGGRVLILHAN